jgi:hypothetical protein
MDEKKNPKQGLRGFTIWVPPGLVDAVHAKARATRRSTRDAVIRLLTIWSAWDGKNYEDRQAETESDDTTR